MQLRKIVQHAGLLTVVAIQLAGCGGGGHTAALEGTLRVAMTNTGTATCGYDEVNISIDAVRANPNANAAPNDGDWQPKEVTLAQSKTIELLGLINSPPKDVVTITLPAGQYAQVRLWLEEPSVLVLKPNSVVRNNTETALDISKASSISIPYAFTLSAGGQVDLTLDFDACKSVVDTGNGTLQLVPAITATSSSRT